MYAVGKIFRGFVLCHVAVVQMVYHLRDAAHVESDYPSLSEQACRKAISHYSENVVAKKYIDLYNKVTGRNA